MAGGVNRPKPGRPRKNAKMKPRPIVSSVLDAEIPLSPPPDLGLTQSEWDSMPPQFKYNLVKNPTKKNIAAAGQSLLAPTVTRGELSEFPARVPRFEPIIGSDARETLKLNENALMASAMKKAADVANGEASDLLSQTIYRDLVQVVIKKGPENPDEITAAEARDRMRKLRELERRAGISDAEVVDG